MCEGLRKPWSVFVDEVQSGTVGCRGNANVWLVVEATPISETDFGANTTQMEESEETRRLKYKTPPRHVSKDKHDARHIAHLQSR